MAHTDYHVNKLKEKRVPEQLATYDEQERQHVSKPAPHQGTVEVRDEGNCSLECLRLNLQPQHTHTTVLKDINFATEEYRLIFTHSEPQRQYSMLKHK